MFLILLPMILSTASVDARGTRFLPWKSRDLGSSQGTGITLNEYALIGSATRKTATGRDETWLFPIDCGSTSPLATEVFVKAFDGRGKQVGKICLPFAGASEINDALCGGQ
jgi:hypothetical protein